MNLYLKGYYGYKNRGDELLLLGLIERLGEEYSYDTLYVETKDKQRLNKRLYDCKKNVKWTHLDKIVCVKKNESIVGKDDLLYVFGGGEVFSDARPFPYNGRNYLLLFLKVVWKKNFIIVGGIGTEKKRGTRFLYKQLLGRAKRIVTRDEGSYTVALKYCKKENLTLFRDFAYNVLDLSGKIEGKRSRQFVKKMSNYLVQEKKYIIINVNIYLWNAVVADRCRQIVKKYKNHDYYFMSAALGSDENLFDEMKIIIPGLKMYDWTKYRIHDTLYFMQEARFVLAARLHILLVAQYFNVSFDAIVYQEKIKKVILRETLEEKNK